MKILVPSTDLLVPPMTDTVPSIGVPVDSNTVDSTPPVV